MQCSETHPNAKPEIVCGKRSQHSINLKLPDKMKRIILLSLLVATSFTFGFAFKAIIAKQSNNQTNMKRVTGIGGIFFKCKDPDKLKEWYKTHLGLATDKYGTNFEWRQSIDSSKKGFTQWSPFAETTKYFEPSLKDFMINYRVDNLESLVKELKNEGVTIVDKMETFDYGKFIHIIDIEGNKVELWEPNDAVYDKFDGGRTK